ncbi:hypothetical protein SGLAM104S_06002 [Streptomyces glaucescens]
MQDDLLVLREALQGRAHEELVLRDQAAERRDGTADLGEGVAVGRTAVEQEAVRLVPVEIALGVGDHLAELAGAVIEVHMPEEVDARVAQPGGRRQTVRVGAGAGAVGDIEDRPVHGGARAGQLSPLGRGEQGVGVAGDTEAGTDAGARRGGRPAGQMRHAASIQMSARDSSRLIRGRQPSRSRAVRTSACCQLPQPSGYG